MLYYSRASSCAGWEILWIKDNIQLFGRCLESTEKKVTIGINGFSESWIHNLSLSLGQIWCLSWFYKAKESLPFGERERWILADLWFSRMLHRPSILGSISTEKELKHLSWNLLFIPFSCSIQKARGLKHRLLCFSRCKCSASLSMSWFPVKYHLFAVLAAHNRRSTAS